MKSRRGNGATGKRSETEVGRNRAREAVIAEIGSRDWSGAQLASAANLDPGTVGDFLSGRRWPQIAKRAAIERAIGWEPGTISGIAMEGDTALPAASHSEATAAAQLDVRIAAEAVAALSEIRDAFTGIEGQIIGQAMRLIADRLRRGAPTALVHAGVPTMDEGRRIGDMIIELTSRADSYEASGDTEEAARTRALIDALNQQLVEATQLLHGDDG